MATSSASDVRQKLAALQMTFKQDLSVKISAMMRQRELLVAGEIKDGLSGLYLNVHSLAGSGGTFGAVDVSRVALELEQILKSILNQNELQEYTFEAALQQVDQHLAQLAQTAEAWQPTDIFYSESFEPGTPRLSNLVYFVENDERQVKDIVSSLEKGDYEVRHFSRLNEFELALEKEIPLAIIMDMNFIEDNAATEVIHKIKNKTESSFPVIFISERDDIEARLAAARAGAVRYFHKPVNTTKLTHTLNSLTDSLTIRPYRVLLIGGDDLLLEYYTTVLFNAGMKVASVVNPLQALAVLKDFKPDIVVMDVYMENYSGIELAQVIRQGDEWSQMPIIFLSTETDFNHQLDSMDLVGDDFLVKPVKAGHLTAAVSARAKRARYTTRLNKELRYALRENQFQLTTMDHHDIVSTTDITGRITSANDKFCEISGYSKEELIGRHHRLLKSGMHPDSFYEEMWRTISEGRIWHGEICNRTKDGQEYWVESTIVPFLDENGIPYKYVSARTDITILRQGEERLSRSQEFANIGTWDWNITTGELYWSDLIWPLFGYDKAVTQTTYDNFIAAIHPDDKETVMEAVNNCVEQGVKYNIEHRVVWPDGSVHWVQESGDVVRDSSGKPLHMLGVVQDINIRKQAALKLIERDRQLQEAQSLAHIGNWQADLVSGELIWSDEIYRIFGYEPQSVKPTVEMFKAAVHPDDLELEEESEQKAATTGIHDVVHRIVRPDGVVRYVHELARAERDDKGQVIRFSGTVQDITDSIMTKQEIIQAREEAENANRAKSQFLSSMSHELRTPLNAIIGFSQLLEMNVESTLSESQKENVDEVLKAGHHLLELINEVLDLAKIEAGRIDLSMEGVVVGEVVSEALQLIYPLAQERGINISLMRDKAEVELVELSANENLVWADHTRLKQVIINLLSNAVKYNTDNGNIILSCNHADDGLIRISVTDTGQGLTQEQKNGLFTAFNRLGAEQTDIEGTGIGLVITKNIINLMGGNIGVESSPGEGSTFWIELPAENNELQGKKSKNKNATSEPEDLAKFAYEYTVLYIEDNPANLRLVSQLLGRLPNVHLWSAHEPLLGLDLATKHQPDLILLDINLPGMDGFDVLKQLRQRDATKSIPVVAISANAMPKDLEKGRKAGFDDYITKPIDVKALLHTVERHLTESTST